MQAIARQVRAALAVAVAVTLAVTSARADVFELSSGGRIEGTWINADQGADAGYVVQTPTGGRVTLGRDQVKRVVTKSPAEKAYEAFLPKVPNTLEGHLDAARRCQEARLDAQRTFHLEQVLKFDPDHPDARRSLGFIKMDGRWTTTEDWMREQGYIRHQGQWRVPQEIALLERGEQREVAEKEWLVKVRRWRSWILQRRGREQDGVQEIRAIDDPAAATALADLLRDGDEPVQLKLLYVQVLGRLRAGAGTGAMINRAIYDQHAEVRDLCLEQLQQFGTKDAVRAFIKMLKDEDNRVVNRAAEALGRLKDPEATLPLIEALTTSHRRVLPGRGGDLGVSFGSNGANGLTAGGGGPKVVEYKRNNQQVLEALTSIHPGINYVFDKSGWRGWYIKEHTPPKVDLRRGR